MVSEIVARNFHRDVNDAVQKAFTVLIRGNSLRKTEITNYLSRKSSNTYFQIKFSSC